MATEYKLSYTAEEIDEKLGMVGNAVLYTAQDLTEEQKAQVRKNIGAASEDEDSGLSTDTKALLIAILRNTVYSVDQSANITDLENALGIAWETVRELSAEDISHRTMLIPSSPYTNSSAIRSAYTPFDIPVESGYEYKVEVASTLDTAQFALQIYNETCSTAVSAGEAYTAADYLDTGWVSEKYTVVISEEVKGAPPTFMRLVFRADENNSVVTEGFITEVTISRKKVQ